MRKRVYNRVKEAIPKGNTHVRGLLAKARINKKIFIYGSPHAGKTTVIASIIYYLSKSDRYVLRRDPVKNPRGVRIIRELISVVEGGEYPEKTPEGLWQEVVFEYKDRHVEENYSFSFQEIAGETATKFDPMHQQHENMSLGLKNTLANSSAVLIVASMQPEDLSENNSITDFIELLLRTKYRRPIIFVASKFDVVSRGSGEIPVRCAAEIYRDSLTLLREYGQANFLEYSVARDCSSDLSRETILENAPKLIKILETL